MVNLENEIKKLGLSDKEAKVYLAILELSQAPAAEIATHSGINRATAYVILEDLRKKGLVSTFLKEGNPDAKRSGLRLKRRRKTIFAAESPERLSNLFEIEKKRIEENFSDLKKIIPDLEKLYEIRGERPKVRFFEGKKGITSIREDILKTKTNYFCEFLPLDEIRRFFSPKSGNHQERMTKKLSRVLRKTIYTTKKGKIFPDKSGKKDFNKFLPGEKFTTEIVIYGRKTAFVAYKMKPIGIIIEDETISDTMRIVFETIWKSLK